MKTLFLFASLIICTVILGSCKKEEAQPQMELLKDGNIDKSPSPDWSFYNAITSNPNNYKFAITNEAAASAPYSLKMSCDAIKNDTTYSYFYQKLDQTNIPTGATLTLKAKVKTVNLQGKGVSLMIRGLQYLDNTGKPTTAFAPSALIPGNSNSDFKEYSVRVDSYPGSIGRLEVFLFYEDKTTGTAYLDDISVLVN